MYSCDNAIISADDWLRLLPDTIYFMRNGCGEQYTTIDIIETFEDKVTEIDITESAAWQYEQWLAETKEACKIKC